MKYFATFIGCLSLHGGPIWWVSTHRVHHSNSDQEMDPHSPKSNFFWGYMLWLFFDSPYSRRNEDLVKLVPDLLSAPGIRLFEKFFMTINIIFALFMLWIGYWIGEVNIAISLFVWGCCLRTVTMWHITWLINSATHVWGYQSYELNDNSKNNWLVALLTFGEGWHNNHHAYQSVARSGHQWYEIDITFHLIKMLKLIGLVSDIVSLDKKIRRKEEHLGDVYK